VQFLSLHLQRFSVARFHTLPTLRLASFSRPHRTPSQISLTNPIHSKPTDPSRSHQSMECNPMVMATVVVLVSNAFKCFDIECCRMLSNTIHCSRKHGASKLRADPRDAAQQSSFLAACSSSLNFVTPFALFFVLPCLPPFTPLLPPLPRMMQSRSADDSQFSECGHATLSHRVWARALQSLRTLFFFLRPNSSYSSSESSRLFRLLSCCWCYLWSCVAVASGIQ
jgi:hypothetical protein